MSGTKLWDIDSPYSAHSIALPRARNPRIFISLGRAVTSSYYHHFSLRLILHTIVSGLLVYPVSISLSRVCRTMDQAPPARSAAGSRILSKASAVFDPIRSSFYWFVPSRLPGSCITYSPLGNRNTTLHAEIRGEVRYRPRLGTVNNVEKASTPGSDATSSRNCCQKETRLGQNRLAIYSFVDLHSKSKAMHFYSPSCVTTWTDTAASFLSSSRPSCCRARI